MTPIPPPAGGTRTLYEQSLEREIDRLEQVIDALMTQVEWMIQENRELKDVLASIRD